MAQRHPAVASLLRHFAHDHLPEQLREISRPFGELAHDLADRDNLDGPELTVALRKLLESKDCAVRAALPATERTV
ncbi:hypothetical protein [Streptomyces sp. NPDC006477]|uniref:hypothetical protein n=1 Tax=Streptomyces sp. NPDC006477 TaxID=3364747 RepID=UPI0036B2B3A6